MMGRVCVCVLCACVRTQGYRTDRQLFVVKPSAGSGGEMVMVYMGVEQAALAAKAVMQVRVGHTSTQYDTSTQHGT